jgi:hypothetical protein
MRWFLRSGASSLRRQQDKTADSADPGRPTPSSGPTAQSDVGPASLASPHATPSSGSSEAVLNDAHDERQVNRRYLSEASTVQLQSVSDTDNAAAIWAAAT